ncbi:MAG: FHA domain-containing protein [Pedosphaera parvula]|nr:FHA domain-containing protein [Pedosphaera parvula]
MVQFKILSGSRSGSAEVARQFPYTVGRAAADGLRLQDAGIWDQHLRLALEPADGFVLHLHPQALGSVNGQPFQTARLRSGDLIEIGGVKLQFWLSETTQPGLKWRETLTWVGLAVVTLAQLGLIWLLLR